MFPFPPQQAQSSACLSCETRHVLQHHRNPCPQQKPSLHPSSFQTPSLHSLCSPATLGTDKWFSVVELFLYPSWKCHYPIALSKTYGFVLILTSQPGLNFPVCCFLGTRCCWTKFVGFHNSKWKVHIRLIPTAEFQTAPAASDFSSTHKWGIVARRAQTVFFKLKEIIYWGFWVFFFPPQITEFEYIIWKITFSFSTSPRPMIVVWLLNTS